MTKINIITKDSELYGMLALWLSDEGAEITDSTDADLTLIDTESAQDTVGAKNTLTLGDTESELPRPFSRLDFVEAVRVKLGNGEASKKARVRVDSVRHRIYHNRNYVALTEKEYAVFRLLYDSQGTPVTREAISAVARSGENETNAADVYVCMLRRKLSRLFGESPIKTIRNCGYKLTFKE